MRVQGPEFGVQGSGFRVQGSGCKPPSTTQRMRACGREKERQTGMQIESARERQREKEGERERYRAEDAGEVVRDLLRRVVLLGRRV